MPTGQADRLMPTLRRVVLARQSAGRTDGELLGAFVLSADADAFAELVRRHGPMVLGVCRRVVGDHTTADDAFQASFLVLARRAASVRPRERVGSWLYGVAYRTALKARTVLARRRSREKQVSVMPEPTAPAAPPAWPDLQPIIDEELARLPDKLRLPVVLCDLEGRPQREVAKHLNVPPATLATRLASARRTLATRLTRRGVTLSGGALAGLMGLHASASAVPHALAAGVVRAVESGAAGALVSAQAVQLSEGVIQMMMLAKLKAVAVVAAVALALTTGVGAGLMPAAAGDGLGSAPPTARTAPAPTRSAAMLKPVDPHTDDVTFLRRLCLDVRGTLPTDVETWYFTSDADDDKRAKVVVWLTDDDADRAAVAKKLGVPVEKIRVVRGKLSADGKFVEVTLDAKDAKALPQFVDPIAFTPDGKKLILGEPGAVKENKLYVAGEKGEIRWVAPLAAASGDKQVRVWDAKDVKPPQAGFFHSWVAAPDQKDVLWAWVGGDRPPAQKGANQDFTVEIVAVADSDAAFLKRVLTDVRGTAPTALELKYFTEDKDPKKREKLLDALLKDAAVQKKLGDEWKKKMLALNAATWKSGVEHYIYRAQPTPPEVIYPPKSFVLPLPPTPPAPPKPPVPPVPPAPPTPGVRGVAKAPAAPQADKLEKLVGELIAAKKDDAAVLEAITLATLSRLPTDSERTLTLAGVSTATDRKAAWVAVARALAGSDIKPPLAPRFRVEVVPPAKP